jgi:hypothetical protein
VDGQDHTPAALPLGNTSDIQCTGDRLRPRAGMNGCGKSRLQRDSIKVNNAGYLITQLIANVLPHSLTAPCTRTEGTRTEVSQTLI